MVSISNVFESLNYEAKKIFSVIQKNGPITKNDISLITELKLTTLIRMMQPLVDFGLVVESKIGESTGGRKPVLYDVNINRFYIIGIDISRTYTQVVITDLKMQILQKHRFNMELSCSPEITLSKIEEAVQYFRRKLDLDSKILLGAGIGTVGPLDREKGIVVNPVNFEAPGWVNVPLKSMIEEKLNCPAILDNGANAAVLAETYFGAGKGLQNVVYFPCQAGDLLVHHSLTIHRADGNQSVDRTRKALGFIYYAQQAKEDTEKKLAYQEKLKQEIRGKS